MRIISLDQIKAALPGLDLVADIEQGFVAYSQGRSVVPPVGELVFEKPPGDVHIKYGYLEGDDYYVIKIASGFYENQKIGLPTTSGMMLLFEQRTGNPVAILHDEGWLTDIRTAIAGSIAAKYLAPKDITCIGIVGTGMQARLQLEYLRPVTGCMNVRVWGRSQSACDAYVDEMSEKGYAIGVAADANELLDTCNLIVTTTAASIPMLTGHAKPGTHITAMGSDTHSKQEVDASILASADLVVADSIPQCLARGEIFQALKAGAIAKSDLVELGNIIAGDAAGRSDDSQVTIADLTGVAVQDIQITKAVYEAL